MALSKQYDVTVTAFDTAALSMDYKDTNNLRKQRNALKSMAQATALLIGYGEDFDWRVNILWYQDPAINTWTDIDWR